MNWIIGDVHGMLTDLKGLVEEVKRKDKEAKFHFVGDYVDRGKDSKGTIDFLLTLENATFIRGNHDDIFDLTCNGKQPFSKEWRHSGPFDDTNLDIEQTVWFCQHGMIETLQSYGLDLAPIYALIDCCNNGDYEIARKVLDIIRKEIPDNHKEFFKNLPFINEQPDFLIVHAFLPDNWDGGVEAWTGNTIQEQAEKSPTLKHKITWNRFGGDEIVDAVPERKWPKRVYCGHTPTSYYTAQIEPIKGDRLVLVDTGAVGSGCLTAYCHETDDYIQYKGGIRIT